MKEYYKIKLSDIYDEFNSKLGGLTKSEASKRLKLYGKNKLDEGKKKSKLIKFLEQFKNLMVIILILASVISFITAYLEGESYIEGFIILGIVILNALFGYIQEAKADKAIEALAKISTPDILVRRDNKLQKIKIEDLVVGDILVLEAGDYVGADARIISSISLKVEEASLTGESGSVSKNNEKILEDTVLNERKNMIYSGSNIVYGKCEAIVVATGMNTELGKIAKSLSKEEQTITPLQKKINNISKILSIIVSIIVVIMIIIGIINNNDIMYIFIMAISLAVAAIPEGLPAVITVILSLGMTRLALKKAVVRKISSVETLGSTEVICSDKTGTITQNKMTVRKVFVNNKVDYSHNEEIINKIMALCNNVVKEDNYIGDPTEIALYQYVEDNGNLSSILGENKRIYEIPFDSERKLMSTINSSKEEVVVYTKGSLEAILSKSNKYLLNGKEVKLTKSQSDEIKEVEEVMSDSALRVLGLAYKKIDKKKKYSEEEVESDLIFVGLVGMIDPPRESVKESIMTCYKAGLKPVMITGDNLNTAIAIATEVGIYKEKDKAIEGKDLDKISDKELEKTVKNYTVYARVTPEHKLRIVKAWQKNNKIVSMTGDGVNDAPALKIADVGVGMGITGTEVSKNVSDIVLLDDSFNTIVIAIEEGRNIYENIRKAISYLLTANIAEILIVFISTLLNYSIFLPIHLLYINLVTDSLPAIALSFEKSDKNIMKKKTRKNTDTIFTKFLTSKIIFSSILKAIAVLAVYFTSIPIFGPTTGTTMAFLTLILLEMTFAISCRNLFSTVVNKNIFSNKIMNISMIGLLVLQVLVFTTPMSTIFSVEYINLYQLGYIMLFVISVFMIEEVTKRFFTERFKD